MWSSIVVAVCSLLQPAASAPATMPAVAATAPAGRPTIVVVVGAEGEAAFGREFANWADRWTGAARRGDADLVQVGRDDGSSSDETDKDRLHAVLAAELAGADPSRPLWLVLIGHGTFDGKEAKFNLRGPDVSADELAQWLGGAKRPLAVVNCASASGPFLNRLAGPGRVVITATRSGSEVHFARLGDHLSAAVADPAADLDKDGQTSLLEAFLAAAHRTTEFYEQEGRLATEHALLDDNGDGLGIGADWFRGVRATRAARDGAPLDGPRAHQWHLVPSPDERAMPPELRARRDALELAIESLRGRKASLPEADYYAQLEQHLLELARLYGRTEPTTRP
jgi:hypothetical protein